MSDEQITNHIYATHVHADDDNFDEDSLFAIGTHGHPENIEEKAPKAGFIPPLCTLKHLSSLDSKAVLTLAAFAMEYGEFWLLTELHSSDQLAKPIGILKRVPTILSRLGLQKHKKVIVELNNLVKVNIDVLKKKNVLLYISALNITIDDILILKPIYDGIRKEDQYKIVWIPIVEQWTDELRKKFEMLRSKMPWYVVQYFSPVVGIKFIKE
ncbi:protein sieve element occlusion b [Quercus suber]|uniref:Protein sieve element occlusion b n=1 Tax=Quercus suber TaxID=58331 RepID=A0AAW0ILV6_QUESU